MEQPHYQPFTPRMTPLAAAIALPRLIHQENRSRAQMRRVMEGFLLAAANLPNI